MIMAHGWRLPNVMHYVGLPLLVLFIWDVAITLLYVWFGQKWLSLDQLPMPIIGSALALLVTLRNNNAYARWWEARQLWGSIVNNSRTLARQVRLYVTDEAAAKVLVELQIAYAHALRCHLRNQPPWPEITLFVAPDRLGRLQGMANVPEALLGEIANDVAALRQRDILDTIALAAFDETLANLGNAQGGAERI